MWKYINASVQGTSHILNNTVCQDNNSCSIIEDSNELKTLIAIVSDGAGSVKKAEVGSKFICEKFIEHFGNSIKDGTTIEEFTQDFFKDWLVKFQEELQLKAESESLTLMDYACTFLVAIVGEKSACFAQIGDGAIVMKNAEDNYSFAFVPQQGEYANETFFATDEDATDFLEVSHRKEIFNEVALFTDGIQNLVLNFRTLAINEEFFSQWFQWLREIEDEKTANQVLESYLNSPKINEKTDDDKTLILAIRNNEKCKTVQTSEENLT